MLRLVECRSCHSAQIAVPEEQCTISLTSYITVLGFGTSTLSRSAGLGCSIRRFGYGFPVHVQTELDRVPQFNGHLALEPATCDTKPGPWFNSSPTAFRIDSKHRGPELLIPGLDVWVEHVCTLDVPITRPRAVTL